MTAYGIFDSEETNRWPLKISQNFLSSETAQLVIEDLFRIDYFLQMAKTRATKARCALIRSKEKNFRKMIWNQK
jgi:hypothetical protein